MRTPFRLSLTLSTIVGLVLVLGACTSSESGTNETETKTGARALTQLTYTNGVYTFDYLKQQLAEGFTVKQTQYVLYEGGSIPVDADGKISFSGTGPGYATDNTISGTKTELSEKPMKVTIRINLKSSGLYKNLIPQAK